MRVTTTTDEAPRALPHRPALDGVRGLAVLAVVLHHVDPRLLPGGFLGVSLFFTLSGFLITNLVRAEIAATGRLHLGRFWARRARRLIPAMLVAVGLAVAFAWAAGATEQLRALPGDVVGALGYVANWRLVLSGDTYGAGYQAPSPLQHFWSLAIEEQFYVLFPVLAAILGWRRAGRRAWLVVLAVLAAGSVAATLWTGSGTPGRVYYGTDTRAFELLAGAALAVVVGMGPTTPRGAATRPARWPVVLGPVALTATVVLWATVPVSHPRVYSGLLWLVAVTSAALLASVLGDGRLARGLAWRPLAALGVVSYGLYLYHWPVVLWLTEERTGLSGLALAASQSALALGAAVVSYHLVERPVRAGRVRLTRPRVAVALPAACVTLATAAVVGTTLAPGRAVDLSVSVRATAAPHRVQATIARGDTAMPTPPARVLFLGDSLVHQSLPGLEAVLNEAGMAVRAIGGPAQTLLGNRDEWLAELAAGLSEFDPDVVVLEGCCGFGDPRHDDGYVLADGTTLPLDSAALDAEWARVASEATDLAVVGGRVVLWVLAPPARTNGYYGPIEGRIARVNAIYEGLASCRDDVGLVDWRVVAAPDGTFAAALPDASGNLVEVRHADGLHFTPAGVGVIASETRDAITARWAAVGGRDRAARLARAAPQCGTAGSS